MKTVSEFSDIVIILSFSVSLIVFLTAMNSAWHAVGILD